MDEFFGKKSKENHKTVILMDEVDGMSSGDRGGVAELIQLIKKTKIPIICACNDRSSPKVRSLANHCLDLRFRRPDARQILAKLQKVCNSEGLVLKTNSLEELVASTHSDIRQILNILSSWKLNRDSLDFTEAKKLSANTKKDMELGPFEITSEFLGSASNARNSINQKLEHYFMDNSLVPLMIQENYLHCKPTPRNQELKGLSTMDLIASAAESLSQSDVLDSLIHGVNQEWSLAPLHGVFSCIIPSYYACGQMSGRIDFPSWLGQYSKTSKFSRLLKELSMHASLKVSMTKAEFRTNYLPPLASIIYSILHEKQTDGIDECIEILDSYYLLKDDFDIMMEMYIHGDKLMTKIPTNVKAAFTRKYNKESHNIPYSISSIAKTAAVSMMSVENENELDDFADNPSSDEKEVEDDLSKDKMIKAKPIKAKAAETKVTKKPKNKK